MRAIAPRTQKKKGVTGMKGSSIARHISLLVAGQIIAMLFFSLPQAVPPALAQQKRAVKKVPARALQPTARPHTPSRQPTTPPPQASAQAEPCRAEILMEADTGTVLFEKDAHTPYPPASMVKMMTAFVTMSLVKEGKASLEDVVTASKWASKIGGSQIYLKEGETFKLEDLLKAVMICSANDAAVAIAEHLSGSTEGFVDLMNMKAQELGMKETTFYSVHGLPPGPGQSADLASAYDLALLGRAIVQQFPKLLEYTSTEEAPIRDNTFIMHNVNKMLGRFKGLDGIKTGFYREAGFCITSTARRGDTRYIAVVMGCPTSLVRFNEAARLLNMGFNMYECKKLAKKDEPYSKTLPVVNGEKKEALLLYADTVSVLLKRLEASKITAEERLSVEVLKAPVKEGTHVGSVTFKSGDKELGTVDLITAEDIPKVSLLKRFGRRLGL